MSQSEEVQELPAESELPPEEVAAAPAELPAEEEDELIGRAIGSYIVTRPLGKGGMGAVYAAEHPVIGSRVAIKFLHPQYSADPKIVDRFFNEARAVNVIGHDNILKILDLNVTEDNRHYFIMEFLIGKALQKLVEDGTPVPLSEAGPILLQFCEALEAAHSNKIYHRDIKPDNVYLIVHKGRKNFVKVVDFGIAKLTGSDGASTGQTQTGMVMGTPAYMSPEQAGGMGNLIDARSDIYSTGAMMYQMATGRLPFPGTSFGEVLIGHLQLIPPSPRELNPEIPEAYEAVIMKALQKKQADRQQTMRQLHDEIKAVMDSLGISAELPIAEEKDMPPPPGVMSAAKLKTLVRPSNPRARASNPALTAATSIPTPVAQATQMLAQPEVVPQKSNVALFAGIAIAVLVLVGGTIGFAMHQASKRAEAEAAQLAERAANDSREAARKAAEEERQRQAAALQAMPITLITVSDPLGASVEGNWTEQDKPQQMVGITPMPFKVPRGAKVRFNFTKAGFLPYALDVIADQEKTVSAKLEPEAKPAAPAAAAPAPAAPEGPKKKKAKSSAGAGGEQQKEDPLPIDF